MQQLAELTVVTGAFMSVYGNVQRHWCLTTLSGICRQGQQGLAKDNHLEKVTTFAGVQVFTQGRAVGQN